MFKTLKNLDKAKKITAASVIALTGTTSAAAAAAHKLTKPSYDTQNHHNVGGMVIGKSANYQSKNAEVIRKNPIVKPLQIFWKDNEKKDVMRHKTQSPPTDIKKYKDISYINDSNIYHRLDVYLPNSLKDSETLPAIIDIHGGGWMYGNKELNEYYCLELAHRGYVVFNISYRLVPDVTVQEQLKDCAFALKWISENAENYHANGKFLLTGDSAGGQLSAYSAALASSIRLREIFGTVDPKIKFDALLLTSPVAFMRTGGMSGVYTKLMWGDWKNTVFRKYMNLSDIMIFSAFPPTMFITSSGDIVARKQTRKAYELFKNNGIECQISDYEKNSEGKDLPHVFSVLDPFGKDGSDAIDRALEFYNSHI